MWCGVDYVFDIMENVETKRNYAAGGCVSADNLFKNMDGFKQINEQSIKGKSLELIMEQLFAEIHFLKEEVDFLREEGMQKSNLIAILTDNTLHKINKQRTQINDLGVNLASLNNNNTGMIGEYNNVSSNKIQKSKFQNNDHSLGLYDDSFLKEELLFLREESKQKSKLIAILTDTLSQNTNKQKMQLRKLTMQSNSLLRKRNLSTPKIDEIKTMPSIDNDEHTRDEDDSAYHITDQIGLKYLTRLRIGVSHLRAHMFNHQFKGTPSACCSCDHNTVETTTHYLLHCSNHVQSRSTLFENLQKVIDVARLHNNKYTVNLLLYGDPTYPLDINKAILESTIKFITDTSRFDKPFIQGKHLANKNHLHIPQIPKHDF